MEYEFWLANLYQIGNNKRRHARELVGDARRLYCMSERQLRGMYLFSEEELTALLESRKTFDLNGEWKRFGECNMRFIPYTSIDYPQKLLHIYDPPIALYVKGRLPDPEKKSVSIVGARACSEYGRSIANLLAKKLATHDVPVISGMALGIDSAAHAGALDGKGDTFAVLGCGCDVCYPKSAENLYRNILKDNGGIISEYMPGTQPLPHFFPMRNRIISALSDIVVIVEAKKKSGSLITADFALEQGKDIYAVPGRYMDRLSEGCNSLISQGAGILYDVDVFLKNTGIVTKKQKIHKSDKKFNLAKEETVVYSCVDLHPKFINLIIEEADLNLLTTLHALDELKKKGLVQETFQNYFCKKL